MLTDEQIDNLHPDTLSTDGDLLAIDHLLRQRDKTKQSLVIAFNREQDWQSNLKQIAAYVERIQRGMPFFMPIDLKIAEILGIKHNRKRDE